MNRTDTDDFNLFVTSHMRWLQQAAYSLSRDWNDADDVVAVTLSKLHRHWRKVRDAKNTYAYVGAVLRRSWLDEVRRSRRCEIPVEEFPDRAGGEDVGSLNRMVLFEHLAKLPMKRRSAVMLRFYCDYSVDETARVMGCSPLAVRSLTSRALETLRIELSSTALGR